MTFESFEKIVVEKYPNIKLFSHSDCSGNSINVDVIFDDNSKVYKYSGSYVEVLNKLKIRACYNHDVKTIKETIERLNRMNGKIGFFGKPIDNTASIERYEEMLNDVIKNCVIC